MKKLPNFKQVSRHSSNTVQEDIKNTPSTKKTYSKSNRGIKLVVELKGSFFFLQWRRGKKIFLNLMVTN